MIKIEKTDVYGWEAAIRGMRNPLNSWDRSDSKGDVVGANDHDLMMRLAKGGSTHAKYRRMITVTVDITAPLYWLKEVDTYKVGTVANSCSTMHRIHAKEFTIDDFSYDHIDDSNLLWAIPDELNKWRKMYLETKDKYYWWQMIQLLPTSYNQKRTFLFNYEVLAAMYNDRKNHKLDEWHTFCDWVCGLPYSELIVGENANECASD